MNFTTPHTNENSISTENECMEFDVINLIFFLFLPAVYNWRGETRYGLPLEIGETLQILEECAGNLSEHKIEGKTL